jgi:flavodoxin
LKTVIIYYTFGGSTKKEAQRLSENLGAPLFRVEEARRRSLLTSFIPGILQAIKRKTVPIKPLNVDLNDYDRIIIGCPVWAGHPAPAFNSIIELLPTEKEVELFFCSAGGEAPESEQETKELIAKKGCTLVSYRDVKTDAAPAKMKE